MQPRSRRLSPAALQVLTIMLQEPDRHYYGLELSKATGVLTGTVYPLLRRLEQRGWLEAHLEEVAPQEAGRPPRILYRLTDTGTKEAAQQVVRRHRTPLQLRTAGGAP